MNSIVLHQCSYEDVKQFKSAAAREQVAITDTRRTEWFQVRLLDGTVIGTAGVLWMGGAAKLMARLKGDYIIPVWRGKGYGKAAVEAKIAHVLKRNPPLIEVFAIRPGLYHRHGFVERRKLRNGAVVMRRILR